MTNIIFARHIFDFPANILRAWSYEFLYVFWDLIQMRIRLVRFAKLLFERGEVLPSQAHMNTLWWASQQAKGHPFNIHTPIDAKVLFCPCVRWTHHSNRRGSGGIPPPRKNIWNLGLGNSISSILRIYLGVIFVSQKQDFRGTFCIKAQCLTSNNACENMCNF